VDDKKAPLSSLTRRNFLISSAAATAGLASNYVIPSHAFAYAAGSDIIRVGVIGCGGRGTGAAADCIKADPGVRIVAMGDLFPDRLERARNQLVEHGGAQFTVTPERMFSGFDNCKKVVDSGVDLVILAEPPGFRPAHLEYAINAGKHVFMEKPVAVDPVGLRSVLASSARAGQKNLAIVAGTQRRHDPRYIETIKRLHDGVIGDVVGGQVYWNMGTMWHAERTPQMSDTEWQIRNWQYFTWLSGDHVVEQHIHNIDVANWVMQANPVKASGMGGRQVRTDPVFGHIFDHFAVELEYADGVRILSMCRQQDGTATFVGERFVGTKGTSNAQDTIRGEQNWRYQGDRVNPYEQEHVNLIRSIRAGRPINEGRQIAESNVAAIMVREAAYTGEEITWDQVMGSDLDLTPKALSFGPMQVAPVAQPGITKLSRPAFAHAHTGTAQGSAR
jgi:predicted dehydrogenase